MEKTDRRLGRWRSVGRLVCALLLFGTGWFSARVMHVNDRPPAVVIADAWLEHVALVAARDGTAYTPQQAATHATMALDSLSLAMGNRYDQLPGAKKIQIAKYLRSAAGVAAAADTPALSRLLRCIDEAGEQGKVYACTRQHDKRAHS